MPKGKGSPAGGPFPPQGVGPPETPRVKRRRLAEVEVVEARVAAVRGQIDRAALGAADDERVAIQLGQSW